MVKNAKKWDCSEMAGAVFLLPLRALFGTSFDLFIKFHYYASSFNMKAKIRADVIFYLFIFNYRL